LQTVLAATREFELGVSLSSTDVSLIQECVALATQHLELTDHWSNAASLMLSMMTADQRAQHQFDRLYPEALHAAVFGGDAENNPIIIADDE
jgi:hypothetical protein